jgi:hypothetical protein
MYQFKVSSLKIFFIAFLVYGVTSTTISNMFSYFTPFGHRICIASLRTRDNLCDSLQMLTRMREVIISVMELDRSSKPQ